MAKKKRIVIERKDGTKVIIERKARIKFIPVPGRSRNNIAKERFKRNVT